MIKPIILLICGNGSILFYLTYFLLFSNKVIRMVKIINTRIKLVGLALLCFFLLAVLISVPPVSTVSASNRVKIRNTGAVYVKIIGEVKEGLNEIFLPIKPVPISLEVYVNDTLIPSILINNSVYIPSSGKGFLTIEYVANTTTIDGKSVLEIISAQELTLIIEPGVILLSLPTNIVKTYYENSNLVIIFYGPTRLEYTITTVTTTPIAPTASPKREAPVLPFQIPLEYITVLSFVIVILVITAVRKWKKHRALAEEEITIIELDELDRKILKELEASKGIALQSELRKKLGIPKATFWRHVKRLEKLGYIEIRKKGRVSELILKKKD